MKGLNAKRMLEDLRDERRAIALRIGGEERWVAAEDAGMYRDAFGAVPPGGLPEAFLEDVPDALQRILRRYARTHGPFTTAEVRARYGVDPAAALRELERSGDLVRGELRPGGTEREWCDPEVLRRLRRASLAVLRHEIEPPTSARSPASCPRGRASTAIRRAAPASTACARCSCRCRAWRCRPRSGSATSCRGAWAPTRPPGWTSCARPASLVWLGAGALGGRSGRVALYFRDDVRFIGPPPFRGDPPAEPAHDKVRERLVAGACFFTDLLADVDLSPEELQEALWDLAWAGEVTNDAFAPLRAPRLTLARAQRERASRGGRRFASRRTGAHAQVQGRWSLTAPLFRAAPSRARAGAPPPSSCSSATGS